MQYVHGYCCDAFNVTCISVHVHAWCMCVHVSSISLVSH